MATQMYTTIPKPGMLSQSKQTFKRICSPSTISTARFQGRRQNVILAASALPPQYSTVKPVGDRIVVKVEKKAQVTSGGVFLAQTTTEGPSTGEIVSLGTGEVTLSLGDKVLYSKFAGTEVELGGSTHVILKQDDCVGTMAGDVSSLKPLDDRILIKCQEVEDTTSGGLILTEAAKEKPLTGEVIAVGPGKKDGDSQLVSVGSTVLYKQFSGVELEDEDKQQYIVVKQADVLASLS
ncbi:20 kDa chaperonin, chloroplastic [Cymbomonas tetramitiformis]|uniref:20 kDa chaperonin, chloroplastic n=1 Tax=Cymbomonas tetramitiformis TaxID=36881 RepID=A0AAE0LEX0_9CHLO|nr:20 kDa chaperonin, chloroplastic [Cymbomonas tetramitiformis]